MSASLRDIQSVFMRRPVLCILLVGVLLTLPFIGISDFYTKGEPREASLAISMIKNHQWVLPIGYADEMGYKPPLMHWIIAGFSMIAGEVNETTSRLPSALGLIGMTVFTLLFLLKRTTKMEAIFASLILLTSFEMHRSGLECRVDMTLAFFMSMALMEMFRWEERGLKGFPVLLVLLLGCASLVKGPVGAVLPCLVFGVYLLILKYNFWKVLWKNVYVAFPALLLLFGWYFMAYRQEGEHFVKIVFAENIGRFLGMDRDALGINYDLGHKGPFWYYLPAILTGFFPWSLALLFAAFVFGYKNWWLSVRASGTSFWKRLAEIDKVSLFSSLVVVLCLSFYSIPSSKRSVYILPVYPFAAYLLTRVFLWLEKTKPSILLMLAHFIKLVVILLLSLTFLAHFIDLSVLVAPLSLDVKTAGDVGLFAHYFQHPGWSGYLFWIFLLVVLVLFIGWKRLENVRTLLLATLILFMGLQFFLEGTVYPVFKNANSYQPVARELEAVYDLKGNTYVMSNLRYYANNYGLNYYLNNEFQNFEKVLPTKGYLIIGRKGLSKLRETFSGSYEFVVLRKTKKHFNEFNDDVLVCQIVKI